VHGLAYGLTRGSYVDPRQSDSESGDMGMGKENHATLIRYGCMHGRERSKDVGSPATLQRVSTGTRRAPVREFRCVRARTCKVSGMPVRVLA